MRGLHMCKNIECSAANLKTNSKYTTQKFYPFVYEDWRIPNRRVFTRRIGNPEIDRDIGVLLTGELDVVDDAGCVVAEAGKVVKLGIYQRCPR